MIKYRRPSNTARKHTTGMSKVIIIMRAGTLAGQLILIGEAIRLNSRFADAYYWLARVYFETRDYNQAIRYYREVLNMEPNNAKADYWLKESQRLGVK